MLERVASQEWATKHSAPKQVIDSAWDAIAPPAKVMEASGAGPLGP